VIIALRKADFCQKTELRLILSYNFAVKTMDTFLSDLSNKEFSVNEKVAARTIHPPILKAIQTDHPEFKHSDVCSLTELNIYRQKYIADYLAREVGELSILESTVLDA
jgi:hypothetical protein